MPIFLHPQNAGDISRLQQYHLWNLIGFPMESAVAVSRLRAWAACFEELPKLRVILAHGGGFFPYQIGRLDHGYAVRPELQARLPRRPSEYLQHLRRQPDPRRPLAARS